MLNQDGEFRSLSILFSDSNEFPHFSKKHQHAKLPAHPKRLEWVGSPLPAATKLIPISRHDSINPNAANGL